MKGIDNMNKQIDYKIIDQVICNTLSMLSINAQLIDENSYDNDFKVSSSVIAMVTLIGDIKVNMFYSMDIKIAESIIAIMMGASEYTMDTIGRSAIAELANMITGAVCTALSTDFESLDITTPTVLTGQAVNCTIHSVSSNHMKFETQLGLINIDLAFES